MITEIEQPLAARVAELMPGLTEDLVRLAGIPSIAFPGFPPGPVREANDLVVDLLAGAGVSRIEALRLPNTPPVPDAESLLFGAQGGRSDLHRPNERVLLDELERAIVAEAEFFREYAGRKEHTG